MAGLTLEVPAGWEVARSGNSLRGMEQQGRVVTFPEVQGTHRVLFTPRSPVQPD